MTENPCIWICLAEMCVSVNKKSVLTTIFKQISSVLASFGPKCLFRVYSFFHWWNGTNGLFFLFNGKHICTISQWWLQLLNIDVIFSLCSPSLFLSVFFVLTRFCNTLLFNIYHHNIFGLWVEQLHTENNPVFIAIFPVAQLTELLLCLK